jgi:hypothetical protein
MKRNAYSTTMLSGLSESCFKVEFDGIKYPFITTTAEVLADAMMEFKASRHYVAGHPLQDMVWIERHNTFGEVTHVWEMDMLSGHFKALRGPTMSQMKHDFSGV